MPPASISRSPATRRSNVSTSTEWVTIPPDCIVIWGTVSDTSESSVNSPLVPTIKPVPTISEVESNMCSFPSATVIAPLTVKTTVSTSFNCPPVSITTSSKS